MELDRVAMLARLSVLGVVLGGCAAQAPAKPPTHASGTTQLTSADVTPTVSQPQRALETTRKDSEWTEQHPSAGGTRRSGAFGVSK